MNWQATIKGRKNIVWDFHIDMTLHVLLKQIYNIWSLCVRGEKFLAASRQASTLDLLWKCFRFIKRLRSDKLRCRRKWCSLRINLLLPRSDENSLVLDVINLFWGNYGCENCVYFPNSKFSSFLKRPRGIIYQNDKICMMLTIYVFIFKLQFTINLWESLFLCRVHTCPIMLKCVCRLQAPFQFSWLKNFTIIFYAKQLKLYES